MKAYQKVFSFITESFEDFGWIFFMIGLMAAAMLIDGPNDQSKAFRTACTLENGTVDIINGIRFCVSNDDNTIIKKLGAEHDYDPDR